MKISFYLFIFLSSFLQEHFSLLESEINYANTLNALYTNEPIEVNGNLKDWNSSQGINFSGPDYTTAPSNIILSSLQQNAAIVKAKWDFKKLYIACIVFDTHLTYLPNGQNFDKDDCIDFYISTERDQAKHFKYLTNKQFQFTINANNQLETYKGAAFTRINKHGNRDLNWQAPCERSITLHGTLNNDTDMDTCIIYEFAIDWETINFKPRAGDALKMEIAYADNDPNTKQTTYDWASIRNYSHAKHWNNLMLSKSTQNAVLNKHFQDTTIFLWLTGITIAFTLFLKFISTDGRKKPLLKATAKQVNIPNHIHQPIHEQPNGTGTTKILADKALNLIKNTYHKPLSTKVAAEQLHISDRHLQRVLKANFNKTYKELLNEERLAESIKLLSNAELTITQISFQAGFESSTSFYKAFRKKYQVSPSDYRKNS